MERITAKDFNNQRSALIQLHEENPGKRGYGEDVRLYPLSESAFYAAFLHGVEIPITEAADCLADLDDETDDGDGVPFDFSEVEGEESEGAA